MLQSDHIIPVAARVVLCLLLSGLLPPLSRAEDEFRTTKAGNRYVRTELVIDKSVLQPTSSEDEPSGRIGVHFSIDPGWHIYWKNSGEAGTPTKVEWELPEGWRVGELRWPTPIRFLERGDITTYGYRDEVVLIADLFSPSVIPTEDRYVTLRATVSWLVCRDICVPGERIVQLKALLSPKRAEGPSKEFQLIQDFDRLTPVPAEDVEKTFALSNFSLNLGRIGTEDRGRHVGWFEVSGLRCVPQEIAANEFQLFPERSRAFEAGHPIGGSVREVNGKCSYTIFLPLSGVPQPEEVLHGVLAVSPRLSGHERDIAITWTLPADALVGVSLHELEQGPRLAYRFVSQTKQSQEPPLGASSELVEIVPVTFLFALLSAFAAGLVLNLMPCVLPIISIKIISFVGQAEKPRRQVIASALSYSGGILATLLFLALVLIVLKPIGYKVAWGFQFQQPPLVFAVTVVVFLLSLAFFDLFQIQLPGMQEANRVVSQLRTTPLLRHFFDGVLATILSTPCSAPFLGTALTFAFTQPPLISITIFLSIGVGLALPYLVLAINPSLVRFLPRPGEWMSRLRQFLGFLLLGTAVWLLFVIDQLTEEGVVWTVALLLLIFFALWIHRWARELCASTWKRRAVDLLLLLLVLSATFRLWPELTAKRDSPRASVKHTALINWEPYSDAALERARAANAPVFIDFTAEWCITCKANEKLAIENRRVADALREYGVIALKADWTTGADDITAALQRFGGHGVPYYVLISPRDGKQTILPTLLTPDLLIEAFREAKG